MKSTERFKQAIGQYLEKRAAADNLFAAVFQKPDKNLDDCVTYILNTVQKSGCNGFEDDEIFSMATHYYDENDIQAGKATGYKVVVNHIVELTEEEKAQARKDAIRQVHDEAYARLTKSPKKTSKPVADDQPEQNLFDL